MMASDRAQRLGSMKAEPVKCFAGCAGDSGTATGGRDRRFVAAKKVCDS